MTEQNNLPAFDLLNEIGNILGVISDNVEIGALQDEIRFHCVKP